MKISPRALLLGAAFATAIISVAAAQSSAPKPNPTHVTYTHLADFKWVSNANKSQDHVNLVGDPAKPGFYIRLAKWLPHNMSRPHYHDRIRYFFVVSGTWWVGSSNVFDENKTYPMTAGTFVTHYPGKAHFDGAKNEPGVIIEAGFGPLKSTSCADNPCPD